MKAISPLLLGVLLCLSASAAESHTASKPFYRQHRDQVTQPRQDAAPVVVNAASYLPGVSPGGLATIFGTNLTDVNGVILAGTDPLPTRLAGVTVLVNGIPAPIFGVAYADGQDQISFQVPYEAPTGPDAVDITVLSHDFETARLVADSFTQDPGIFMYRGNYAVALRGVDYSLIGPDNPVGAGDVVILYTTGLGPLTVNLIDGVGAPSSPLAYTRDDIDVTLAGEHCRVLFSGIAPGYVGLYQVNFVVPRDAPSGRLDLQIHTQYDDSGIATLPVF